MSMDDFYNRINWENYPTEDTPLSDTNLNKMDYALKVLSQRTATLDANKLELTPASGQGIVYYDYSASKIKTSQYLQFYPYPDGGSENFITFSSRELSDDQYQMPLHEMFIYPNLIEFNEYQSDGDSYAYYLDINRLKQILGLTFSESYVKDGYSLEKYFDIDYDTNKAEAGISLSAPLDYENPEYGKTYARYTTKGIAFYDDDQGVYTDIPLEDLANVIGTTSNIQTQLTTLNSTLALLSEVSHLQIYRFWNSTTSFTFDVGFTPTGSDTGTYLFISRENIYLINISDNDNITITLLHGTNTASISMSGTVVTITTAGRLWGSSFIIGIHRYS